MAEKLGQRHEKSTPQVVATTDLLVRACVFGAFMGGILVGSAGRLVQSRRITITVMIVLAILAVLGAAVYALVTVWS